MLKNLQNYYFNPKKLPGLQLWLASDHASLVRAAGMAAQFTAASSQYLSIADNASLSTGDIDFTIAGWVYLDSKPANRMVIYSKRAAAPNDSLLLQWLNTTDRFAFNVWDGTNLIGTVSANSFGAPSTGTWYYVVAWHDSVANTVNIQVNNGTVDSAATTGVPVDTTSAIEIGRDGAFTSFFWNGRMQVLGFWKSVLTAAQITRLYNGGTPLAYDQLDPSEKDAASLISYWEDPTKVDLHGTNNLTNTNGVTQAAGTVLNAVTTWSDLSGQGVVPTQATQASKPVVRVASSSIVMPGGKRGIRFDGTDDTLSAGNVAALNFERTDTFSIYIVAKRGKIDEFGILMSKIDGNSPSAGWFIAHNNNVASNRMGLLLRNSIVPEPDNVLAVSTTTQFTSLTATNIIGIIYRGTSLASGVDIYVDGRKETLVVSTDNLTDSIVTASDVPFRIGARAQTATTFFNGDIFEVIIYNKAHNAAEANRIHRYLSQKYGISLT